MAPVHADVMQRAVDTERGEVTESLTEKGGEFAPIHLARRHRKRAMMDRAEAARVTIDRHIVWRIGEHDRGAFVAQQRRKGGGVEGTTA